MSPLAFFYHIMVNLEKRYAHLARGYMLSAPAIEYKGRAFAFCQRDNMVIKIGDSEQLMVRGIPAVQKYQPFNNRVSCSQWREVPYYYRADWPALCEMALDALKRQIDDPEE